MGAVGFLFWNNFLRSTPGASTGTVESTEPNAAEMTELLVQQIKDKSYSGILDVKPVDALRFIWTEGGYSTAVETPGYIIRLLDKNSQGFSGPSQAFEKYPDLAKLYNDSEDLAISKGFKLNRDSIQNTIGKDVSGINQPNRTTAFASSKTHCALSEVDWSGAVGTDSYYTLNLSCVDNAKFKLDQYLQSRLVDAFVKNPLYKEHQVVMVDKQNGDYIKALTFSAGSYTGGGMAVFHKVSNKWTLIFGGQSIPNCSDIDGENIPTDIYSGECYDQNTGESRKAA